MSNMLKKMKTRHAQYFIMTSWFVAEGNPHNVPSLYTAVATDMNSAHVHIIRPALRYNRTSLNELGIILRTEGEAMWINS